MSIPIQKLGWIAGVIDLKGRIVEKNNKARKTRQLVMVVDTKELLVIRELCSLTGTKVELKGRQNVKEWMRRSCIEHCPEPHIHVPDEGPEHGEMPAVARWTLTGAGAAVVLHNVLPFLLTDRPFQEMYEEILSTTPLVGQGSGATLAAINRLKSLGWEIPEEFSEEPS